MKDRKIDKIDIWNFKHNVGKHFSNFDFNDRASKKYSEIIVELRKVSRSRIFQKLFFSLRCRLGFLKIKISSK